MDKTVRKYLAEIGRKGGAAGTGKAKKRGNSAYYRRIRSRRNKNPRPRFLVQITVKRPMTMAL